MDTGSQRKQVYGSQKSMLRQFGELLVILIAAAALLNFFNIRKTGSSSVFSFHEDSFTFTPCDGIASTVAYGEIRSLSLVDTPESFGICSSGGTKKNLLYGCWEDSGGETLIYVQTTISKTILLETAQQKLMFNYTDGKSTEALYASLFEIWQEATAGASGFVQTGE